MAGEAAVRNAWLASGPDTMPEQLRARLHSLLTFHRLQREGVQCTREEWLEMPVDRKLALVFSQELTRQMMRTSILEGAFHERLFPGMKYR